MNVAQILSVLKARWIPALIIFLLVVAGTLIFTFTQPKLYTASASMVVDITPDPVSAMMFGGRNSPAMLTTQVEIIRSDRVAQRVVRNLKLAEIPAIRQQWQDGSDGDAAIENWLTDFLQKGVRPAVSQAGSNVINVGYTATDPTFAATVANAFVQAYLQTAVELRVDPAREYSGFFSKQVEDARKALEAAQNKLSDFQRENSIIGSGDRYDLEMNKLSILSEQLVALQSAVATSQTRADNAAGSTGVMSSAIVSSLRGEVAQAQVQLQNLKVRYGNKHPEVIQAEANLAELRNRLAVESGTASGVIRRDADIDKKREVELQASVDEQRAKVLALKNVRDQAEVLNRDVQNAQHAYDLLLDRYNQSTLQSQNRQTNASLLALATPPRLPSSPKIMANLLVGFVFALAAAGAIALLLEHFDRRVRTATDAVKVLGLPVIGIMPRPTQSRRFKGQLLENQRRVISGRRLPALGGGGQ